MTLDWCFLFENFSAKGHLCSFLLSNIIFRPRFLQIERTSFYLFFLRFYVLHTSSSADFLLHLPFWRFVLWDSFRKLFLLCSFRITGFPVFPFSFPVLVFSDGIAVSRNPFLLLPWIFRELLGNLSWMASFSSSNSLKWKLFCLRVILRRCTGSFFWGSLELPFVSASSLWLYAITNYLQFQAAILYKLANLFWCNP